MADDKAQYEAQYWIDKLKLEPHPEGGFYRLTYTAPTKIAPQDFAGARPASTGIYFLLAHGHFSAFHRLKSDEMWHFYAGQPLIVHIIDPNGTHSTLSLGNDPDRGEQFQAVVPAGCWFASEPSLPHSFALVGCTVAPGFDFADFELAACAELTADYPQHRALIEKFTRQ
jgi:predicted cupin superfamily sugar epimerase